MSQSSAGLIVAGILAWLWAGAAFADERHADKDTGHDTHHHKHQGAGHAASHAGEPGRAKQVSRTIQVRMLDSMRFEPSIIQVKSGETVKFVVTNTGKLRHEFGIGTAEEQAAHAEMMLADPDMKHDDGNVIAVAPGQIGALIWHFGEAGEYQAGCQVPGHYPAGMKATIVVKAH
jgi:uncharacterized cupredoxin-like copper-binding protein